MLKECHATRLVLVLQQGKQWAWSLHLCEATAPASGKCQSLPPTASPPQPHNAGQSPFPALTASHKGTWWEQAHATDSAAPSNMPKQLVNIKAHKLVPPLASQAPCRLELLLLRVGPGYRNTIAEMDMDEVKDGHPLHIHHRIASVKAQLSSLFPRVERAVCVPKRQG